MQPSFIPDRPHRELRELVRYRRSIIRQRAQVVNRIQKVLEGANIKLSSVATDVAGASELAMLHAIVEGEDNPQKLAQMSKGRLRDKIAVLEDAFEGSIEPHQRFMLQSQLSLLEFLSKQITELDEEVSARMSSFLESVERIDEIPGIGRRGAEEILAEIGTDMSQFPSAEHLCSWAKVAAITRVLANAEIRAQAKATPLVEIRSHRSCKGRGAH